MSQLTEAGLFAGIGGFQLGAQRAGFNTTWMCEIEWQCRKVLRHHFPEAKIYFDARKLSYPPPVDLLTMGFPCQNISGAGKGQGITGDRSSLWTEGYRIISEIRPRAIIIENSPRLLHRGFEYILHDLSKIGYDAQWTCISAKEFGYRHYRERLFIVAYPLQVGCPKLFDIFRIVRKKYEEATLNTWWTKKTDLSFNLKRFDRHSNFRDVHLHNGISRTLDNFTLETIGNAVVPEIAHYLCENVKLFLNGEY